MSEGDKTYTADLIGSNGTEQVELEFISGLPQKSFVRAVDSGESEEESDVVWELDESGDGYTYREAGRPGADYS